MEVSAPKKDSMMRLFRQSMSFKSSAPADSKQDASNGVDRQNSGLPPLDMAMLKKAGSKSFSKKFKESFKKTFTPRNSLRKSLSGSFRGSVAPSVESSAPSTVSEMSESPVSTPKPGSPVIKEQAGTDDLVHAFENSSPRDSASDYIKEGSGKNGKTATPRSNTESSEADTAESASPTPKHVLDAPAPTEDIEAEEEIEEPSATISADISPPSTPMMAPQTPEQFPEAPTSEAKLAAPPAPEPVLAAVETLVEHVDHVTLAKCHMSKPVLAVEGPAALAGLTLVDPKQARGSVTMGAATKKRGFSVLRVVLGGVAVVAAAVMGAHVYGERKQPKKQAA